MSFEWRTDDDKGWQEKPKQVETAVSNTMWQRRWRYLLVALLGVAAVWLVVQWQINRRVATATIEVESELLNTHNFVLQTAANQDVDLFKSNLSGRDPAWGEVQQTLLADGLLLDRPMLGWHHVPLPDPLSREEVEITIAPTFDAAELLYPQTYAVQTPAGVTETVTLQQTAVYRLGERRWLYAPPLDDFWGDWITQGGDYLTVAYPERDRDVAARLAIHLDRLVGQMCAELADLNCGSDLRLFLRLATGAEALLATNEIENVLKAGLRLELPAPTLVGLPTDEASYEVLYQAYGVQLATAVLAHQVGYECCRHELFFRALRDYQLAQLELQAWPLQQEMYSRILSTGFDGDVMRHWTRRWEDAPPQFLQVWVVQDPEPIWQQVYMLIEFLNAQETAVSATQMMRLMDRNSNQSWLNDVLAGGYEPDLFRTRFLEYIYSKSSSGQLAAPPIPLPDGKITLICDVAGDPIRSNVYQYDLTDHTWAEPFPDLPANRYIDSWDGEHFVVTEYEYRDAVRTHRFYLLSEEGEQLLEEFETASNTEHWVNYFIWERAGSYLMRYENNEGDLEIALRSLECPADGCPEVQLDGFPTFSPDTRHLLYLASPGIFTGSDAAPELELFLLSLEENRRDAVGQGGVPFWIDNNTFGFVRSSEAGWEVVTNSLSGDEPHVLLRQADLLAEIPEEERPAEAVARTVIANPQNPRQLLLQLYTTSAFSPESPSFVFRLTLSDDFTIVQQIELLRSDPFSGTVGFSPDGLYVIVGDYGFSSQKIVWYFLDQETNQQKTPIETEGYNFSWSLDGQWYVQSSANFLLLHAPQVDYAYFIPHRFLDCHQVILSVNE